MAKRKTRVATFRRDETTREPQRHHFFTSSYLHWRAGDDLEGTLKRQREADMASGLKVRMFNVWRVPGISKESHYHIENYTPQADGAEFICTIWYDETDIG